MRNKKCWKRLMALVLSAAMLVPAHAAYATERQVAETEMEAYAGGRAADEDGFEIEDGVLKKYTGTATEVVIPEGVTSIGERAFVDNSKIISVSIPKSVTNIGTFAFAGCYALTGICIPAKVVSIGSYTF